MHPDTLTFAAVYVDGHQSNWLLASDGTLLPHVRGGSDAAGDGGGADGAAGGTGDAAADAAAAAAHQQQMDDAAAKKGDDTKGAEKVEMTQAELDAMIEKRVAKARKAAEDEAKTKAERDKLDEAERLKAEKADADRERDEAKKEALEVRVETAATKAALTAKVDPTKVDRFLKLADLDDLDSLTTDGKPDPKAIEKLIATTLKQWPEFLVDEQAKGGKSGGSHNGHAGQDRPKTLSEAINAKIAANA